MLPSGAVDDGLGILFCGVLLQSGDWNLGLHSPWRATRGRSLREAKPLLLRRLLMEGVVKKFRENGRWGNSLWELFLILCLPNKCCLCWIERNKKWTTCGLMFMFFLFFCRRTTGPTRRSTKGQWTPEEVRFRCFCTGM